jgi:hypothetical protein
MSYPSQMYSGSGFRKWTPRPLIAPRVNAISLRLPRLGPRLILSFSKPVYCYLLLDLLELWIACSQVRLSLFRERSREAIGK